MREFIINEMQIDRIFQVLSKMPWDKASLAIKILETGLREYIPTSIDKEVNNENPS